MAKTAMISRPQRRAPAILLALVLIAFGAAALWASVQYLITGSAPSWFTAAHAGLTSLTWGSVYVLALSIGLALVGLLFLWFALKPGQRSAMTLIAADSHDGVQRSEVVLARRALAQLVVARAAQVDGVNTVDSSVSTRSVHLRVTTSATDTDAVRTAVVDAVTERLTGLGFLRQPSVSARVRSGY